MKTKAQIQEELSLLKLEHDMLLDRSSSLKTENTKLKELIVKNKQDVKLQDEIKESEIAALREEIKTLKAKARSLENTTSQLKKTKEEIVAEHQVLKTLYESDVTSAMNENEIKSRALNSLEHLLSDYDVKEGNHKFRPFIPQIILNAKEVNALVKFNDNVPVTEYINKLFGLSFSFHHHINSARFGYKATSNGIELFAYTYAKRKRSEHLLAVLTPGHVYSLGLVIDKNSVSFRVSDQILHSVDMKTSSVSYQLNPYHGGESPAEHDYTIELYRSYKKKLGFLNYVFPYSPTVVSIILMLCLGSIAVVVSQFAPTVVIASVLAFSLSIGYSLFAKVWPGIRELLTK